MYLHTSCWFYCYWNDNITYNLKRKKQYKVLNEKVLWKKFFVSYICRWDFSLWIVASTLIYLNRGHGCFYLIISFLLYSMQWIFIFIQMQNFVDTKLKINKAISSSAILLKLWNMHTVPSNSINYTFTKHSFYQLHNHKFSLFTSKSQSYYSFKYMKEMQYIYCIIWRKDESKMEHEILLCCNDSTVHCLQSKIYVLKSTTILN